MVLTPAPMTGGNGNMNLPHEWSSSDNCCNLTAWAFFCLDYRVIIMFAPHRNEEVGLQLWPNHATVRYMTPHENPGSEISLGERPTDATLPETNIVPDGLFSEAMLVSGRVHIHAVVTSQIVSLVSQAFKAAHSALKYLLMFVGFHKVAMSPLLLARKIRSDLAAWATGDCRIAGREREREREWTCPNGRHENREWMSSNQWNWSHLGLTCGFFLCIFEAVSFCILVASAPVLSMAKCGCHGRGANRDSDSMSLAQMKNSYFKACHPCWRQDG